MENKLLETLKLISTEIKRDKVIRAVNSFSHGNAGTSLYYYTIGKYLNDDNLLNEAHVRFEDALFSLEDPSANSTNYFGGFAGIFWLYQFYINENFIEHDLEEDYFSTADNIFLAKCYEEARDKNLDFLYGIIGYGVYFLERNRYCDSTKNLNEIILILDKISMNSDKGVFWEDTFVREDNKGLLVNLGLAHGIPSVILFLAHAYKATESPKAIYLLEECIRWMQHNELGTNEESMFPYKVFEDKPLGYPSRLAWCYGDLGIAASILFAGVLSDNKAWKEYAIKIALKASKRSMIDGKSGVKDAGFCHGSSGVAFIFILFRKITGQAEFETAANYWTDITLSLKDKDADSGFFMEYKVDNQVLESNSQLGLLDGSAGIGLSLLSCLTDNNEWSRSFMLNLK